MAFKDDPDFINSELLSEQSPTRMVYAGYSKSLGREVVYKVTTITAGHEYLISCLHTETRLVMNHKSPHICEALNYKELRSETNEKLVCVVTERLEKDWDQELEQRQKRKQYYREQELWQYLAELVGTLAALQKVNLAHRDLKPANIFLQGDVLKIGDFGSSRDNIDQFEHLTVLGTTRYLSPLLAEAHSKGIIHTSHNVFKSDVYSLGITFIHAMFLSLVDKRFDPIQFHANKRRILAEKSYSENWQRVVLSMVEVEEANRPDFVSLAGWIGVEPSLETIVYSQKPFCAVCNRQSDTAPDCLLPCNHYLALCTQPCIDTFVCDLRGKSAFRCPLCRKLYSNNPVLSQLLAEMREAAPFACSLCGSGESLWSVCCTWLCELCIRRRTELHCNRCSQAYSGNTLFGIQSKLGVI